MFPVILALCFVLKIFRCSEHYAPKNKHSNINAKLFIFLLWLAMHLLLATVLLLYIRILLATYITYIISFIYT